MTIYAKKLSKKWREAFEEYETACGFEPMHQDEIDEGEMTVQDAWESNVAWLGDVFATVQNIQTPWEDT